MQPARGQETMHNNSGTNSVMVMIAQQFNNRKRFGSYKHCTVVVDRDIILLRTTRTVQRISNSVARPALIEIAGNSRLGFAAGHSALGVPQKEHDIASFEAIPATAMYRTLHPIHVSDAAHKNARCGHTQAPLGRTPRAQTHAAG